jgi:hypothetical protein
MAQPSETKLTYIPCATTPEAELNVLAAVHKFVLDCRAKKEAARPAAPNDGKVRSDEFPVSFIIPKDS